MVGDLFIGHNHPPCGIDTEDLTWAQAALLHNAALLIVDRAHFAGTDHIAIIKHHITGGAQTVAIQNGANDAAIAKGHRRGTIPRLYQCTVILVKGAAFGVDFPFGHALPCFGHHHHQGVADVATAAHQQFQSIV